MADKFGIASFPPTLVFRAYAPPIPRQFAHEPHPRQKLAARPTGVAARDQKLPQFAGRAGTRLDRPVTYGEAMPPGTTGTSLATTCNYQIQILNNPYETVL